MNTQTDISTKVMNSIDKVAIAAVNPNSLSDYKNEVALTLFYAGCNIACSYCFNKDLLDPSRSIVSFKEAIDRCFDDEYHTALVLCGGEPTIYPVDRHIEYFKSIHPDIKVKLFTNGINTHRIINAVNAGLDCVSIDIKYVNEYKAIGLANIPSYIQNIKNMLNIISRSNKKIDIILNTVMTDAFSETEKQEIRTEKEFMIQSLWLPENITITSTETKEVSYG